MKNPARTYKRRFIISSHALDRFRERVDEELKHRDDHDLGNLFDDRVHHATHTHVVKDPRVPDIPTQLCEISCHRTTDGNPQTVYYAVVRENTVVTLLDEQMARNNFGGQWGTSGGTSMNRPFSALGNLKIPVAPAKEPIAESDPLAEAGIAYARARKQASLCAAAVEQARAELLRAEEAMREATLLVDDTHQRLLDLTSNVPRKIG